MSLLKKHPTTPEEQAARQTNGRQSHGAASAEGRERTRAANLRHGFYSKNREEALLALGEDPAALEALRQGAHDQWQPANLFQASLSDRMARLLWRMERADRIQESLVARKLQQFQKRRHGVALQVRYKRNDAVGILGMLESNAADPRFYTPRDYFQDFSRAFGEGREGAQKEILQLMHRLRKPTGGVANPQSPTPNPGSPAEDDYLQDLALWDESDFPIPGPDMAVAAGTERDELREELRYWAKRELAIENEVYDEVLEEHERPLTRIELDELQATPPAQAELMRREEQSCFRELMRLGNFLMKIQDRGEEEAKNEGISEDVDENTETAETAQMTNCPEPAAHGAPGPPLSAPQAGSGVRRSGSEVGSLKPGGGRAGSDGASPRSEVGKAESGGAEAQI